MVNKTEIHAPSQTPLGQTALMLVPAVFIKHFYFVSRTCYSQLMCSYDQLFNYDRRLYPHRQTVAH